MNDLIYMPDWQLRRSRVLFAIAIVAVASFMFIGVATSAIERSRADDKVDALFDIIACGIFAGSTFSGVLATLRLGIVAGLVYGFWTGVVLSACTLFIAFPFLGVSGPLQ